MDDGVADVLPVNEINDAKIILILCIIKSLFNLLFLGVGVGAESSSYCSVNYSLINSSLCFVGKQHGYFGSSGFAEILTVKNLLLVSV